MSIRVPSTAMLAAALLLTGLTACQTAGGGSAEYRSTDRESAQRILSRNQGD